MRRNDGFTLLELLVALALLATLTASLYATYFGITTARDRAEGVAEKSRELRSTLDGLRRELSSAFYRPSADPAKPLFRFVVEDRDFFAKPASGLLFSTIAPPVAASFPVSDQVEIEYRPESRGPSVSLMRRTRDIYRKPASGSYPQMEEIESFLVECFDGNKWIRNWDTRLNGGILPRQVRVTLTVKDGDKIVPFTAVVTPRQKT